MAQLFSLSSEELRSVDASAAAEQGLSLLTEDVRRGWWVERPSASELEVADPYGNETAYYLDGTQLKLERPDGDVGVLLDGVAALQFDVHTVQRLREDTPASVYGELFSCAEPTGTPEVLTLLDGDSLGLAFTVPSDAPDSADVVSGVAEQLLQASLDRLVTNLSVASATPLPVIPIVDCVKGGYACGKMIGYFGYDNPNPFPVTIPIGPDNMFSSNPKDRGQPQVFYPGRHSFVFSATFYNGTLVWHLNHKLAKAGMHSPVCSQ